MHSLEHGVSSISSKEKLCDQGLRTSWVATLNNLAASAPAAGYVLRRTSDQQEKAMGNASDSGDTPPRSYATHDDTYRHCPRCNRTAVRIRRRFIDRVLSLIYPVHRFQCISMHCGWKGNLRAAKTGAVDHSNVTS
jgi:hypothetical protein